MNDVSMAEALNATNNASGNAPDNAPNTNSEHAPSGSQLNVEKIVVIGGGPAGIRFAEEYLKRRPFAHITVMGNEPYQPYNRVQLSSLLAGDIGYDDITTALPSVAKHPNFELRINTVRSIDHAKRVITDINGEPTAYDRLVIATGARPHVPNIPGTDQRGVYTFRNLKDAEFLYARVSRARHIVVVGGGLLGLESAKALSRFNTRVTLIQQGPHLMNRQLDAKAAKHLSARVNALGIRVITNSGVRHILGEGRVEGVITRDKEKINCDTVLLCAGIKPNIEIARSSKIKVARGILVNDRLETSAHRVYAIGECCEHRNITYGLVNPGFEQAAILADQLCGGEAHYQGSLEISRLKVLGTSVCSMGEVNEFEKRPFLHQFRYHDKKRQHYRKIVLFRGRIIGAVAFGDWNESRRVQEAYQNQRRIWPWQILLFLLSGRLFGSLAQSHVTRWAPSTVVCQCQNITQGQLMSLAQRANCRVETLQQECGAGTVCGSCKPLLAEIVGDSEPRQAEKYTRLTLLACLIAAAVVIWNTLTPGLTVADSVQTAPAFEAIWNDKFWKQVTGFSLLGMSTLGLLLSLRKKLRLFTFGDFARWRLLHISLGVACAFVLILHTGFHFGANLNQALLINFLAVIIFGSAAGAVFAFSHKLSATNAKKIRAIWTWAHIILTWPLPILLSFHILSVYYF